jgi:hypothetical protein
MDPEEIVTWISGAFDPIEHVETDGNRFFFFDPDQLFPFATLVTNDLYDRESGLGRPGVYRMNIGVGRQTWVERFGEPTKRQQGEHGLGSGTDATFDFRALDVVMPHPVYGRQHWLCVLNPSETTFDTLKPALAEAYEIDRARSLRRRSGAEAGLASRQG